MRFKRKRMVNSLEKRNLLIRLWEYHQERFPPVSHGILIASFSLCAVCLSALLRGDYSWPNLQTALTAFICLFLFFLQLRIADEFKDCENDAKFRPERAVPRGLVSLKELAYLGIFACFIQLLLAYLLHPPLLVLVLVVWVYMAFMSVEFFVGEWLKVHLFVYLWTHMLIMPLIDLFATACDWLFYGTFPPEGLIWFLIVSCFNGVVLEIGRKTWAPEQEREGVESYSADWGIKLAILTWVVSIVLSLICACIVATKIGFFIPVFVFLLVFALILTSLGIAFICKPTPKKSKSLEILSGLWVAGLYLILGVIPMGYHIWIN